jgi:ABC-type transport system involved in multi-copper enzyme maturation permease subunit
MKGNIVLMEFRTGWKGIIVFTIIILLASGGFPSFYPTIKESTAEDLEGMEFLTIDVPEDEGGFINLSWIPVPGAVSYNILEENGTTVWNKLSEPIRSYNTTYTNVSIPYDFQEKRYYSVYFIISNSSKPTYLGLISTKAGATAFDTLLENPAYAGLAGGRELSFLDIRGFLALEIFSWWVLLAGLYLAWRSVASVGEDYREKRMDLIFSTPVSRRRYILGKFASHLLVTLLICFLASAVMTGSVAAVGEGDNAGADVIYSAVFASLPLLMCIQAFGLLGAVYFKSTRTGIGVAFLFLFVMYAFNIVAAISKSLQNAKYATIMYYWDYTGILLGEGINAGHFTVLTVLTILFLLISIWTFEQQDIPA